MKPSSLCITSQFPSSRLTPFNTDDIQSFGRQLLASVVIPFFRPFFGTRVTPRLGVGMKGVPSNCSGFLLPFNFRDGMGGMALRVLLSSVVNRHLQREKAVGNT